MPELERGYFIMAAKVVSTFFSFTAQRGTLLAKHAGIIRERCASFATVSSGATVDTSEATKFSLSMSEWWDTNGPQQALHAMNALRAPFIVEAVGADCGKPRPLEGCNLLEVGCGGGILSEPLARLGAMVTAIDPTQEGIQVAQEHLKRDSTLSGRVLYKCCTTDDLLRENKMAEGKMEGNKMEDGKMAKDKIEMADGKMEDEKMTEAESKMANNAFDCVVASEVVEHVSNVDIFVSHLSGLVKPGGAVVMTTISRTASSYLLIKIMAEYVLRVLPVGTHDWQKFVTPEELKESLLSHQLHPVTTRGMNYNPFTKTWSYMTDTSVNYIICAVKTDQSI